MLNTILKWSKPDSDEATISAFWGSNLYLLLCYATFSSLHPRKLPGMCKKTHDSLIQSVNV